MLRSPLSRSRSWISWQLKRAKWQLTKRLCKPPPPTTSDLDRDAGYLELRHAVRPYTMVTPEGLQATRSAVEYIVARGVPGALVECGVWRGGMSMAMAITARRAGDADRHIYLFDTFAGMSEPTDRDLDPYNPQFNAREKWEASQREGHNEWCYAGLDDVRRNLLSTGYPNAQLHFVEGKVEETIPAFAPETIALLRIDTDWYESTKHALERLYPRLAEYGVLLLDDYGAWDGARAAVDEYFAELGVDPFLVRVDFLNRVHIKLPSPSLP